ncbi:MAG: hypothetical protein J6569_05210 [Gilliamella sp.]|uniref:hypothetical protein n=1 Tax=unclassified Gilliamella TaxID=2685620 RepID=UPI001580C5FE|nr:MULTISPECIES: hypothetical protein [unclassified Gilliamella]MCO6536797.1 hypothetical protein [Gilliamella sp.]MCO6539519.1 hypothetical protein [Gilliamella sp.]MCO6556555.1 hypothetical protein [Gilliamella sp.]MCO6559829.1 hypothetical protein [Gilliamella sp.]NUE96228.1 hypothetical protein [Gilliamella sp. ESL0232]
MYQITRFATLDIDLFFNLDEYRIIEDFGYGDISGIGKVCGYQILFFYISDNVEALSIDEVIDNTFLCDKANQILDFLGFDFKIGQPFELTNQFNHNYRFKDHIYEEHMRYYYVFDNILITLGINLEGVLVSFEMVKDQCIINNRLETFKS